MVRMVDLGVKQIKRVIIILLIFFFSTLIIGPAYSAVLLQRVHLKAVGDIMVHDVQYRAAFNYQTGNYDFFPMFSPVKEDLQADLLVGNLETTLSGPETGYSGYPRFNSPDNLAETLAKLGFDLLFTANNHSLDKGELGLRRTLEILDENKINHTGTFLNKEETEKPCIITVNGISFGFLNYTYGTNGLKTPEGKDYLVNYINIEILKEDIQDLKPLVDLVVVGLHFGNEYWQNPSAEQKYLVQEAAQAGADIILGSHPHVLQPYEFIDVGDRQCFVVYSLGNFISGQKKRYTDSGAILDLIIEKSVFDDRPRIVKVDFTPVWVRRFIDRGNLKIELVPARTDSDREVALTAFELGQITQVINDTNNLWQPLEQKEYFNTIFSVWANNYLPLMYPNLWIPALLNIK